MTSIYANLLDQKKAFLLILRIHNCSNLPFNVTILYCCNFLLIHIFIFYFFIFYWTCIDSSVFLKLMQRFCINMFKLLLLSLLLLIVLVLVLKVFNSHRTGFEHQHGRCFIVLGHTSRENIIDSMCEIY